jgi:hypothetical protein
LYGFTRVYRISFYAFSRDRLGFSSRRLVTSVFLRIQDSGFSGTWITGYIWSSWILDQGSRAFQVSGSVCLLYWMFLINTSKIEILSASLYFIRLMAF